MPGIDAVADRDDPLPSVGRLRPRRPLHEPVRDDAALAAGDSARGCGRDVPAGLGRRRRRRVSRESRRPGIVRAHLRADRTSRLHAARTGPHRRRLSCRQRRSLAARAGAAGRVRPVAGRVPRIRARTDADVARQLRLDAMQPNVATGRFPGLSDFGVVPTPLEQEVALYLARKSRRSHLDHLRRDAHIRDGRPRSSRCDIEALCPTVDTAEVRFPDAQARHRQQELLVVVAARLAHDDRSRHSVRRSAAAAVHGALRAADRGLFAGRTRTGADRRPASVLGGLAVWDTLAIAEYLAERHPDRALWPSRVRGARAGAHAVRRDACRLRQPAQRIADECLRAAAGTRLERRRAGRRRSSGGHVARVSARVTAARCCSATSRSRTHSSPRSCRASRPTTIELPDEIASGTAIASSRWTACRRGRLRRGAETEFVADDEPYRRHP